MKLSIPALAWALGLFWGCAILLVGAVNLASPGYGSAFLQLLASIYPGYNGTTSLGQIAIVTLYGIVDGVIGGAIFAWLYNWMAELFTPGA